MTKRAVQPELLKSRKQKHLWVLAGGQSLRLGVSQARNWFCMKQQFSLNCSKVASLEPNDFAWGTRGRCLRMHTACLGLRLGQ